MTETVNSQNRWRWFHRFGSPAYFYDFAGRYAKWFAFLAFSCLIVGSYLGLWVAPKDYQMGDSYRIIFVHVPSAWMSMFTYAVMATAAAIGLIWRMKLAYYVAKAIAPVGAMFTFCALVTGALWGKPTWGTYWQWDARMTSELVLLFLYLGYMAIHYASEDRHKANQSSAIVAIVGIINLPIIHYSVEWWNSLHQGSTIKIIGESTIHSSMLYPLLIMVVGFQLYFFAVLLYRTRVELMRNEHRSQWLKQRLTSEE